MEPCLARFINPLATPRRGILDPHSPPLASTYICIGCSSLYYFSTLELPLRLVVEVVDVVEVVVVEVVDVFGGVARSLKTRI